MSYQAHRHAVSNQTWLSAAPANFERFAAVLRRSASRSMSPEREITQMIPSTEAMESIPPISVQWDPLTKHFHCWEGHVMTEKLTLDPPLYDEGYTCDFCARIVTVPVESETDVALKTAAGIPVVEPFLHCTICAKDVCFACREEILRTPRFHRQCLRCRRCGGVVARDSTEKHLCHARRRATTSQSDADVDATPPRGTAAVLSRKRNREGSSAHHGTPGSAQAASPAPLVVVTVKRLPPAITSRTLRELCTVHGVETPMIDYDAETHQAVLQFSDQIEGDAFVEGVQGRTVSGVAPTWSWRLERSISLVSSPV